MISDFFNVCKEAVPSLMATAPADIFSRHLKDKIDKLTERGNLNGRFLTPLFLITRPLDVIGKTAVVFSGICIAAVYGITIPLDWNTFRVVKLICFPFTAALTGLVALPFLVTAALVRSFVLPLFETAIGLWDPIKLHAFHKMVDDIENHPYFGFLFATSIPKPGDFSFTFAAATSNFNEMGNSIMGHHEYDPYYDVRPRHLPYNEVQDDANYLQYEDKKLLIFASQVLHSYRHFLNTETDAAKKLELAKGLIICNYLAMSDAKDNRPKIENKQFYDRMWADKLTQENIAVLTKHYLKKKEDPTFDSTIPATLFEAVNKDAKEEWDLDDQLKSVLLDIQTDYKGAVDFEKKFPNFCATLFEDGSTCTNIYFQGVDIVLGWMGLAGHELTMFNFGKEETNVKGILKLIEEKKVSCNDILKLMNKDISNLPKELAPYIKHFFNPTKNIFINNHELFIVLVHAIRSEKDNVDSNKMFGYINDNGVTKPNEGTLEAVVYDLIYRARDLAQGSSLLFSSLAAFHLPIYSDLRKDEFSLQYRKIMIKNLKDEILDLDGSIQQLKGLEKSLIDFLATKLSGQARGVVQGQLIELKQKMKVLEDELLEEQDKLKNKQDKYDEIEKKALAVK